MKTVLEENGINEFLIAKMNSRYGLNKTRNSAGRKLKTKGEYCDMYLMTNYPFFARGLEYYLIFIYLTQKMIIDANGGYKTIKHKNLFREMETTFDYKYTAEELETAYNYLVRNNYLYEIYDATKYQGGKSDPDVEIWITDEEAINTFEAMMIKNASKNGKKLEDD